MPLPRLKLSQRTIFILLMIFAALAMLAPRGWTDPIKHVTQVVVPAEDLSFSASHKAAARLEELDREAEARHDNRAEVLMRELASEAALSDQLRKENDRLRALREEYRIPPSVPILPAKVVAHDIVAWRDSALIQRGSLRDVSFKDWVTSRLFLDQGAATGAGEGHAVLAREALIGRIEQVSPYMSRVQLFSDVDCPPIAVQIGSIDGTLVRLVDYPCSLRGEGRGRMKIADVPYKYIQTEDSTTSAEQPPRIKPGDVVFSAPEHLGLPVPLAIGRVESVEGNPKKRLVYDVHVVPVVSLKELRDVYIISTVPLVPFD